MKKVENESPLRRNLHRAPSSRARYCLNDPSIDSREREKIRKAVVEKGNGEGNENSKSWRFFFFFFFSNGSASRSKAQTMLISQRVSSIYKSIPGGCLAPSPCVCVCRVSTDVCIFHSIHERKLLSRETLSPSGLSIGRMESRKQRLWPTSRWPIDR